MARKGYCKLLEIDTETRRTGRERKATGRLEQTEKAVNRISNSTTFPNIEYQLEWY